MEIFDLIYYITIFIIPVAPYFFFFRQGSSSRFRTNRDWLHLFKSIVATPAIKKYQKKCRESLDENVKQTLEEPKKIRSDIYEDNHFIYGIDQKGNSLSLRFSIRSGLVAEVFLCLRLENGAIFTFPGDKISQISSITRWKWKTKELLIDILEPFKRLRVTYNGLLKNANHNVEHVQFNFIWVAAGHPQFYPQDAPTSLLADALAQQKWRDGDWISLLGDERGYEQFGSLWGFIKGDSFTDDLKLNLPSCRTRFWGTTEKTAMERTIHLLVVGEDGAVVNLWIKALKTGCKELQYGNIIKNNGQILPITNSDVRIEHLGQYKSLPTAFTVHVKANGIIYKSVFHLNLKNAITTSTIISDQLPFDLTNIPAECDMNTQQAKSLVEFWYNSKKTQVPGDHPPLSLLIEKKTKKLPNCYISSFEEESSRIVQLTGGKGCSLALLTSLKSKEFVVPEGFIVTVNAFNKQLEVNFNMKKAVAILEDICYGRLKGDCEQACKETVKTFQSEEIFSEIKEAVIQAIQNISSTIFAVRSSAIGEDSEELSAAGQNETFLGCDTPDEVIKAISSCWASLFTYQSVQYRHQHGLPVASQMAVVVQKMIPTDCAGVLFTCHPSTGNPAHVVITANHGLGESVVSGRSEPDTVILHRTYDNNLTIKSKLQGSKKKMIRMVEGVVQEENGIEEFSITDSQALQLGKVGVFLEEKFGGARDIEWGYFQGRLFLLQARPITTLHAWSNYELLHEFDVASMSGDDIYTIANTGEVLPGAVSALTESLLVWSIEASFRKNIEDKYDPHAMRCLASFQHHLFINVIDGIHRRAEKNISMNQKIIDLAIFGHPIINEKIHSTVIKRFGLTTKLQNLKEIFKMIRANWQTEDQVKLCKHLVSTTEVGLDKERDTLKDMYTKIEESIKNFDVIIHIHSFTTKTSVSYQFFAMMTLAEGQKDFNVDHYNDVAMLLASCDDVISAEIPKTLADISSVLVKNNQAEEFAKIKPEDGQEWLQSRAPEAAEKFAEFIEKHGHRAMREFDLFYPTWSTNPSDVIRMIQTNCKTNSTKQEKVTKSVEEVIASLVSPKKSSTRKTLKFIMKKSRRAVGLREQTKSETIRFVNKIRIAYKYLGERMALAGLIPHPELIFHLTHYEVGQIIDRYDGRPALIAKALKRQKLYPKWDQLKFPEISYGVPQPEIREFIPRTGSGKVKCEGTPACIGSVQARACVITDLADIDQLHEGDVLITYCTDIGWSPYFPLLGGIVTELGGLVSHGAVIAREYGLPCIVGAKGATKFFKTGDIVIMAGKTGTIELL